nr:Nramp family divalent metal transporter [Clostridium sp. 19966]
MGVMDVNRVSIFQKSRNLLKFMGPAFMVSVAYVDPGNFATNIAGGSQFNYSLIWVILLSNLMAIFLQFMSAKLGIATDKNLCEACAEVFSRKVNWFFWIVAELAAMATTIAEFLGGALGFYLLLRIPLTIAGILTALITLILTYMQKYGQKLVERSIIALLSVISIAYTVEMFLAKPDWNQVAIHTVMPQFVSSDAILVAVGMLGATVMPHVIYLHSQLVQERNIDKSVAAKKRHFRMEKIDIVVAMNIAFIINAAMVIVSAAVFYKNGIAVDSIEQAHKSLQPLLGNLSSTAFGIALLASGFSSSAVGTMAGETVMDGFVNIKFPAYFKRMVTMIPAMVIILLGINAMKALVISQVCLSFALPVAIIPMLIITSKKALMKDFVNSKKVKIIGIIITSTIVLLNVLLIFSTLFRG